MLTPTEFLTLRIESAGLLAPAIGALVGIALTLSPIAWPSVPAVVALVGPARAAAREDRPAAISGPRGFAVVLGFVIGMDGVIATLSAAFVSVLVLFTRAAVVLSVVAIIVLTYVAVRLLLARTPAVCRRLDALPPDPLRAVSAGVAFSVSGCPGCAPVAAAVGTAAAASGPLLSLVVVAAFVVGRAGTLCRRGVRWTVAHPSRPAQGAQSRHRDRRRAAAVRGLLCLPTAGRPGLDDLAGRRSAAALARLTPAASGRNRSACARCPSGGSWQEGRRCLPNGCILL